MLLGLALRLGLALAVDPQSIDGDPRFYDRAGVAVSEGRGWPRIGGAEHATALHPPAWPYLLGATYAVTGVDSPEGRWRAARIVNALLGAAAVLLLGLLGRALFTPFTGLAAAGLYAVYPAPAILGTTLLSEPLFVALMLAALLAGHRRWLVTAGVLLGLAALTRPNGILLLLPLALLAGTWRRAVALAAIAALTIAPWTIRNYVVTDHLVPVATNTGKTLAGTYNETARGYRYRWAAPEQPDLPNEVDRSSELTSQAIDYSEVGAARGAEGLRLEHREARRPRPRRAFDPRGGAPLGPPRDRLVPLLHRDGPPRGRGPVRTKADAENRAGAAAALPQRSPDRGQLLPLPRAARAVPRSQRRLRFRGAALAAGPRRPFAPSAVTVTRRSPRTVSVRFRRPRATSRRAPVRSVTTAS